MSEPRTTSPDSMEADLAAWGKAISLETVGRRTGQLRRVTIGFVEEPMGTLLVAASSDTTHWAQNLIVEPSCYVDVAGSRRPTVAEPLEGPARGAAVAALILKYGTPAERLGGGPAFRLVPRPAHP